jgi:hypothetical protein
MSCRSAILVGLVSGFTFVASASAAPSYYGYFANAMYERGTGNYINDIKDHANLSWIEARPRIAGARCNLAIPLKAEARGLPPNWPRRRQRE